MSWEFRAYVHQREGQEIVQFVLVDDIHYLREGPLAIKNFPFSVNNILLKVKSNGFADAEIFHGFGNRYCISSQIRK